MISALSQVSARCFRSLPHKRQLSAQVRGGRQGTKAQLIPLARMNLLLVSAERRESELIKGSCQLASFSAPVLEDHALAHWSKETLTLKFLKIPVPCPHFVNKGMEPYKAVVLGLECICSSRHEAEICSFLYASLLWAT